MLLPPLVGIVLVLAQTADWSRFVALVEPAVPREGRVRLLYEVVDPPNVYSRELIGFDYDNGGIIRIQSGTALGVSPTGRQFAGRLSTGCSWLDPTEAYPPAMLNPSALKPAPAEVLRLVLARPELVLDLRPRKDGGFEFEMDVFQGVPGMAEADIPASAVVRRDRWIIKVGPDGRVRERAASTTIKYDYGDKLWPVGYERTGSTGTRRYELVRAEDLPSDALTPEGAMAMLTSVETQRVREPSGALDAAKGVGAVPKGYARDPSGRWSFALILGGVVILLLGGGVLVRKRLGRA
ncbi:MAG: hypothetical protein ACIAS6_02045 [Phycisphaerales bacterium JB060]